MQNDVDAVEKMLIMLTDTIDGQSIINNGVFDAVTGYAIFRMQQRLKKIKPNQVIDGIISPAQGINFGPGTVYTIVNINVSASVNSPQEYKRFRETFKCTG